MGHHKTLFSLVSFINLSPLLHLQYSLIIPKSSHSHIPDSQLSQFSFDGGLYNTGGEFVRLCTGDGVI